MRQKDKKVKESHSKMRYAEENDDLDENLVTDGLYHWLIEFRNDNNLTKFDCALSNTYLPCPPFVIIPG